LGAKNLNRVEKKKPINLSAEVSSVGWKGKAICQGSIPTNAKESKGGEGGGRLRGKTKNDRGENRRACIKITDWNWEKPASKRDLFF